MDKGDEGNELGHLSYCIVLRGFYRRSSPLKVRGTIVLSLDLFIINLVRVYLLYSNIPIRLYLGCVCFSNP